MTLHRFSPGASAGMKMRSRRSVVVEPFRFGGFSSASCSLVRVMLLVVVTASWKEGEEESYK
jgi:hypothetical protein